MASENSGVARVGGTEMWVEGDIIHVKVFKEKITIDDVKESVQSSAELAQTFEGKAKVLVDGGALKSIERDARIYIAQTMTADKYAKAAGVPRNPVQRLIASFALGLQKVEIPAKVFGNMEEAEKWLKE